MTSGEGRWRAAISELLSHAKTAGTLEAYLATPAGHANLVACLTTHEGRAEFETQIEAGLARLKAGEEAPEWATEVGAYSRTERAKERFKDALRQAIDISQPSFGAAVRADTAIYARAMLDVEEPSTGLALLGDIWRLAWETDAFFCLLLYRLRVRLLVRKIPFIPAILHRMCMVLAQVDIGDAVIMDPGVILLHGQVVMDGVVRIGAGTVIAPWVTLGRTGSGFDGPAIEAHALIGTGSKVLGRVKIGDHAHIGANAVVLADVEPYGVAVGMPARVVRSRRDDPDVVEMREALKAAFESKQDALP